MVKPLDCLPWQKVEGLIPGSGTDWKTDSQGGE